MEGFLTTLPPFSHCGVPGCVLPAPGSTWGKRGGRFMTPHDLDYLERCRASLSQVGPGAMPDPLLRWANTNECGVQVNNKVDKTVQCSLGPKTLLGLASEPPGASKFAQIPVPELGPARRWQYDTPPRFLRPVSVYSPGFDPRLFTMEARDDDRSAGEAEAAEHYESYWEGEAYHSSEDTGNNLTTSFRRFPKGAISQFLEQRYGFFHCKKCNIRWESAYVWCISGTRKVYYKQLCRKCQVGINPYKVEPIICKACGLTSCCCDKKHRHVNMNRPHRQDLCCRCRGMRLPCDSTYSFKYTF
ncbi:ZAR1-like protein [Hippoglossus hippoglossus]|uniref:ZAR1-like protein n=1 Tax=Hippoglossus hippoglossus TaxID=8267 RepID=UPI00148D4379|nr:ZAR1-like protein [Hippoglossus hippoglossus]